MEAKKLFLCLLLIYGTMSLKLQIVDEDYVSVKIGYPPKDYKLLIDPVGPFTYIFKDVNSTSEADVPESKPEEFTNVFGKFSGVWRNDFFYLSEDKLMNFRMDYVKVTNKESRLECDGVIGLGYSKKHLKGNIYEVLESMENVFKSQRILSYNKKTMQLTLGELPTRSNYNPSVFKIYEKDEYPGIFLKMAKLRFVSDYDQTKYISEENIGDDAMLTLVPVIIAPKNRLDNLYKNFTQIFNTTETKVDGKKDDGHKFYTDVYLSKINEHVNFTEIVFDRMAYKFKPFDKREGEKARPTIRFGNAEKYSFKYWYIGIDVIGVDRVDFDFEKQTVKLYSKPSYDITKSKPQLLIDVFVYMTVVCIFLGFAFRAFCQTKRLKDIEPGEELLEI